MNSKTKGNVTEAIIISEFVKRNIPVLLPFGDNERYDIVIQLNGIFKRVQCKTARRVKNSLRFECCSSQTHRGKRKISYKGEIDYFAIYSPEFNITALIPIEDTPNFGMSLKISHSSLYSFDSTLSKIKSIVPPD